MVLNNKSTRTALPLIIFSVQSRSIFIKKMIFFYNFKGSEICITNVRTDVKNILLCIVVNLLNISITQFFSI